MPNFSHTYHPINDSFDERARACKSVLNDLENAEISLKMVGDKDWENRLGTQDEIRYAKNVAENSLQHAAVSLDLSELHYAKEQGLLTIEEVNTITLA